MDIAMVEVEQLLDGEWAAPAQAAEDEFPLDVRMDNGNTQC